MDPSFFWRVRVFLARPSFFGGLYSPHLRTTGQQCARREKQEITALSPDEGKRDNRQFLHTTCIIGRRS